MGKQMIAFIAPHAPRFPFDRAVVVENIDVLKAALAAWTSGAK
jgi:hypothetical protein